MSTSSWRTAHRPHLPNALTMLRILAVPVFVWFLAVDDGESTGWRFAAFAVFLVAIITDRYDGYLARRWNVVSDFGKIADPIADKALIGAGLIVLSLQDRLWWWATIVILIREVGITIARFLVIRRGVVPAGKGGKVKTVVQACAVGLYVLPLPDALHVVAQIVMLAAVVLTLTSAREYVPIMWKLARGRS